MYLECLLLNQNTKCRETWKKVSAQLVDEKQFKSFISEIKDAILQLYF